MATKLKKQTSISGVISSAHPPAHISVMVITFTMLCVVFAALAYWH